MATSIPRTVSSGGNHSLVTFTTLTAFGPSDTVAFGYGGIKEYDGSPERTRAWWRTTYSEERYMPPESATEIRWLSTGECWQRLAEHPTGVGRVGMSGSAPDIIPVNYVVDGRNVVFRAAKGQKLDNLADEERIVFEVDDTDATAGRAWFVVLRGYPQQVTDPDVLARLRKLPLRPWDPRFEPTYIRVDTNMVEGREIS